MDEGNTPSNCPSCLKDTSKDEKENFLPVGPSVQVKGSDGNSRPSNSNTAGVQYVNHLHQNADRSDGFNATVDDKGNSGKPFVRISVPVKDGNIGVNVLCENGTVKNMIYNFNHLSDKYPKHKSNFTVKNAPGVDYIMQNNSELFFDTVEEMEQTHDSTLTEVRKGCLVLEFEHKDEASARAMVADKDKIEKIFKVFAAKCGKELDNISVEAEYKMYEKLESEVFEPTSLPVEDTLASGVTDIPSESEVSQHIPLHVLGTLLSSKTDIHSESRVPQFYRPPSYSSSDDSDSSESRVPQCFHPSSYSSSDDCDSLDVITNSQVPLRTSTRSPNPPLLPQQKRPLTPPKSKPSPKPDASPFSSYGQTSSNPDTISRPQTLPRTLTSPPAPKTSDVQRPSPRETPSREQVTLLDQSLANPQDELVWSQLTDPEGAELGSLAGVDREYCRHVINPFLRSRSESESARGYSGYSDNFSQMTEDEEPNARLEAGEYPDSLIGYALYPLSLITSLLRRLGMMKQNTDPGHDKSKKKIVISGRQARGSDPGLSESKVFGDSSLPVVDTLPYDMTDIPSESMLVLHNSSMKSIEGLHKKRKRRAKSEVCQHMPLHVPGTLLSSKTNIPSVSGVLQAHGPLSSTRSGDSYISDFGAPEVNRPFSFTRSHSLSSLVIDTLLPPYFWSTDFTSCQYLNETDTDLIKTKTEVTKNIGAVRNSGGGTFILNIKSHQMDAWKEHDNTFWEPCLKACLLDDEFQSDVFSITEDLQNNKVVVAIEPSSEPITCKYNTKVRSQTSLLDPTRRQMHSLMQGKRRLPESSAELRGIKRNLKEGCNIAIERVKYSEPLKDISCFVKSLFEDLRLSEYISAFSKERDGGSYFLGIEFDGKDERGKSSKYVIKGVPLEAGQQNNIICLLQEYMTGNIIVLDGEMQWSHPPPDLIKVALHPAVERNRYVIEVAVRPFNGVVFCDKMGPESYSCIYGHLQRFSKEDWLIRNRYAIF